MARRLIVLLAALLATATLAPGAHATDGQNRVGAFLSATPILTGPDSPRTSSPHRETTTPTRGIAAGCCGAAGGGSGGLAGRRAIARPQLDRTGKVHGELPEYVPRSWPRSDVEELAQDLRGSIRARHLEQTRLGEHGPHRTRIEQERRLLRQIDKVLSGS